MFSNDFHALDLWEITYISHFTLVPTADSMIFNKEVAIFNHIIHQHELRESFD